MNAGFFFAWLFFYLLAGRTIGAAYAQPIAGAVIGTLIGIFPAAMLCSAAHYSDALSLGVFPLLIIFVLVPEGVKFWVAVVFGAAPLAGAGGMALWGLAAGKGKKKKPAHPPKD